MKMRFNKADRQDIHNELDVMIDDVNSVRGAKKTPAAMSVRVRADGGVRFVLVLATSQKAADLIKAALPRPTREETSPAVTAPRGVEGKTAEHTP